MKVRCHWWKSLMPRDVRVTAPSQSARWPVSASQMPIVVLRTRRSCSHQAKINKHDVFMLLPRSAAFSLKGPISASCTAHRWEIRIQTYPVQPQVGQPWHKSVSEVMRAAPWNPMRIDTEPVRTCQNLAKFKGVLKYSMISVGFCCSPRIENFADVLWGFRGMLQILYVEIVIMSEDIGTQM